MGLLNTSIAFLYFTIIQIENGSLTKLYKYNFFIGHLNIFHVLIVLGCDIIFRYFFFEK